MSEARWAKTRWAKTRWAKTRYSKPDGCWLALAAEGEWTGLGSGPTESRALEVACQQIETMKDASRWVPPREPGARLGDYFEVGTASFERKGGSTVMTIPLTPKRKRRP